MKLKSFAEKIISHKKRNTEIRVSDVLDILNTANRLLDGMIHREIRSINGWLIVEE